jgi:hypothetical protein
VERPATPLRVLADIVVIAGILLFFLQERNQNYREKVARSVDYARSLHSGDFADARIELLEPWIERRRLIETIFSEGTPDDRAIDDLMMTALDGEDPEEREKIITALYRIEGLFLALRNCIDARICDAKTAWDVVGQDATELACFFGTGFDNIEASTGLQDFGEGILHFTDLTICKHLVVEGSEPF